jgi:hypothetical protein
MVRTAVLMGTVETEVSQLDQEVRQMMQMDRTGVQVVKLTEEALG